MKRYWMITIFVVGVVVAPHISRAANTAQNDMKEPAAVVAALASGYSLKASTTVTPDSQVIVWLLQSTKYGYYSPVFSLRNTVISGSLLDSRAQDVTPGLIRKLVLRKPLPAVFKSVEDGTYQIFYGSKKAKISAVVFADPNCLYCHEFWLQANRYIREGILAIHWVLVPMVRSDSRGKAATILMAKDPIQKLNEDELHFDVASEAGAVSPATRIPPAINDELSKHLQLLFDLGYTSVPLILYRNERGKVQITSDMQEFIQYVRRRDQQEASSQ